MAGAWGTGICDHLLVVALPAVLSACSLSRTRWCQEPQAQTIPVAEGRDEVEAAVHPVVLDILAIQATLISEILLKLLVDVFRHRLPAGARTDKQRHCGSGGCLVNSGLSPGSLWLSLLLFRGTTWVGWE